MSSEQLNKKFTFSGNTPPSNYSSFSNSTSGVRDCSFGSSNSSNHLYGLSIPIVSSSNFVIPLEDLRLDANLIEAYQQLESAGNNVAQIADAKLKLELAEANAENQAILEINLENYLLEANVEILVHSKYMPQSIFEKLTQNSTIVYLYGIISNQLSDDELHELSLFQRLHDKDSIFFVKIPENTTSSSRKTRSTHRSSSKKSDKSLRTSLHSKTKSLQRLKSSDNAFKIFCQLHELKFLNIMPIDRTLNILTAAAGTDASNLEDSIDYCYSFGLNQFEKADSDFCDKWDDFYVCFLNYIRSYFRSLVIKATTILYRFHEICLGKLINFTYEMVRDTVMTPRKIEYAKEKELTLFENLNTLATLKQEELKHIINSAIEANREPILSSVENHEFHDVELVDYYVSVESVDPALSSDSSSIDSTEKTSKKTVKYAKDYKKCINQINELVMNKINVAIAHELADTVEILKENYLGTLKRCLKSLEEVCGSTAASSLSISSSSMSSTSQASSQNNSENNSASNHLQQIINSAYDFEINISERSNILQMFVEKIKELFNNMPWNSCPILDKDWKILTANNLVNSISASKLSKVFCNQMRERLKSSHSSFLSSIRSLENKLNSRMEKNEECQRLVKKQIAPKFAKLSLESASLRDYLLFGFPLLSKEIGRGQYGVVYSCLKWGNHENLAIKSVVPPDEKHWNDLALEFHYSKQIVDHDNIVKLLGTVIDYTYGNGLSPAILFIMERMKRDLYIAIKMGLEWKTRLNISIDVVEGIRYLHSRGLVHRDIKLKNVLLDVNNRAKLTDLGFCKPNAMISGSIVGTPIHMSPEVFDSKYDSSVDIYAFGILFWYICAGSVHLPKNFESCNCKDDLWDSVKKGLRPERLLAFDDEVWNIMESCWRHDASQRPHIGAVAAALNKIKDKGL